MSKRGGSPEGFSRLKLAAMQKPGRLLTPLLRWLPQNERASTLLCGQRSRYGFRTFLPTHCCFESYSRVGSDTQVMTDQWERNCLNFEGHGKGTAIECPSSWRA